MDTHLQAHSAGTALVSDHEIGALRGVLRGCVLLTGEPGYDAARAIWNGMIDRRPGMIVQALGATDVIHGVNFAREHGAALAVRGGGHNIAGNAVCEGGSMLDLSHMRSVQACQPARRHSMTGRARDDSVPRTSTVLGSPCRLALLSL